MLARHLLVAAGGSGSFACIADPALSSPSWYQRTQLTTTTYDGSGQAVHPSVVKISCGWHGFIYWMAMEPYPGGDSAYENPSILVSNDGTTWAVPAGLTNPVVPNPGGGNYNSDGDLVFYLGTLFLFYRSNVGISLKTSTDGITWSGASLVISLADENLMLSPAILRGADGTWRMWSVNKTTNPNTLEFRTASGPSGTWSAPSTCTATDPEGRDLWHLDVSPNGSGYRAVITTCTLGGDGSDGRMELGSSADGTTWSISTAVISPSGSGWDSLIVYRGSMVYEASRWRCWYSGCNGSIVWHIGYTELNPVDFP